MGGQFGSVHVVGSSNCDAVHAISAPLNQRAGSSDGAQPLLRQGLRSGGFAAPQHQKPAVIDAGGEREVVGSGLNVATAAPYQSVEDMRPAAP